MRLNQLLFLSNIICTVSAFFYDLTNPVGSVNLSSFPWNITVSAPLEFSGFTLDIAWNITNGDTLFMAMRLQAPIGGSVLGQSYAAVGIGYGMLDSKAEFWVCHNNQDNQNNIVIHEHYSTVTYAPPLRSQNPAIKPIVGLGGRQSQVCLFSRPLDPKDGHLVINPNQQMNWVWAYNANPNSIENYTGKPFPYHGSKRGAMNVVLATGSAVPAKVSSFNTKVIHGFGMMFTWLVVIPFAIYYAHFFRSYIRWMYIKIAFIVCGVVFSLLFLVIVLFSGAHFDTAHGILGITIFCLLFLQICLGIVSVLGLSKEKIEKIKRHSNGMHKILGYCVYVAAMAQIGLGVNILYPWVEPRQVFPWVLFIGGGSAWLLIFLIGDIWRWTSSQGSVESRIANALDQSETGFLTIKGRAKSPVDDEKQLEAYTWKSLDEAVTNEGRMLVVGNGKYVYDISRWIHSHPGGQIILQAVNGTDITNDYFNESGFDAESVTFSKSIPKRAHGTGSETANFSAGQSRADIIAVKRQSLNLSISSSEAVKPLKNVEFSKEEWAVIQRCRRTHIHSLAAVKRLASLVVGRLLPDSFSSETLNVRDSSSGVQGQLSFDVYEYRRYALVSIGQQEDLKHYYKLKFCLLYPYDTRKGEPSIFFPGQSVQIEVKLANGKRISRYYTPISGSLASFEILVKRKEGSLGEMSNFLANSHQGERQFKIRGPFGRAFLPTPYLSASMFQRTPETIVFIAGGSGITPAIQLVNHLFLSTIYGLKVAAEYTAQSPDEMDIKPGQTVQFLEHYGDGWAYAINHTTGREGSIPVGLVLPVAPVKLHLLYIDDNAAENVSAQFGMKTSLLCYPSLLNVNYFSRSTFTRESVEAALESMQSSQDYQIVICGPEGMNEMASSAVRQVPKFQSESLEYRLHVMSPYLPEL